MEPTLRRAQFFGVPEIFAMHDHVTLLTRLGQIASEPCSYEERVSHALALLNVYTARLYARVGIGTSNRLARTAKSFADQTLADLRREILAAEVRATESYRKVLTAVRYRIEMARRVLASRITEESDALPPNNKDQESIDLHLIRQGPDDHRQVASGIERIREFSQVA
jgi:hypothetical protein